MSEPQYFDTIAKNKAEDVRVALDAYYGIDLIDVRTWRDVRGDDGEIVRVPSKKGISLKVAELPALIAALTAARNEAVRRGLLTEASI
ncbi:MAG: transcriptional coactivator p15/PC4 family protein [Brevundimonas sp.]